HQELLRRTFIPVAPGRGVVFRAGISQPGAICRNFCGPWMGAAAVRGGAGVDVPDLCRHVVEVSDSSLLLLSPSHQQHAICLPGIQVDVLHARAKRCRLARNEIRSRRITARNGLGALASTWYVVRSAVDRTNTDY